MFFCITDIQEMPMGALIVHDDVLEHVQKKLDMYDKLVWYARKAPAHHPSWEGVPEDIKTGALNSVARVEEMFPDECDELRGEHSDWTHGFNSGCLAAIRFILTAASEGPETAEEWWPELDT